MGDGDVLYQIGDGVGHVAREEVVGGGEEVVEEVDVEDVDLGVGVGVGIGERRVVCGGRTGRDWRMAAAG